MTEVQHLKARIVLFILFYFIFSLSYVFMICFECLFEQAGWGEFEAGIRIFFRDPEEQPIDLNHVIKLYHQPPLPPLSLKKVGCLHNFCRQS